MGKYRVCVYAICKNEETFVERWYTSMKEADSIYVLDTGSTDNTVKLLKELGVNVTTRVIEPWRFDTARNMALELVPEDYAICVCTDLDEVFNKGWRSLLENNWNNNINRVRYNYNWSLDDNNKPLVNFYLDKIHQKKDYKWMHPVHEVLTYMGDKENIVTIEDIVLNHYPDKNKSRSSYLPLLELSVEEDPEDDRNMHYLGREYMYYGRWNECIDTLIRHLNLPKATWRDERCASMRFIARSYKNLNRIEEARMWYDKAIKEAPYLRDGYVEKGILEYELNNYRESGKLLEEALSISNNYKSYINEYFTKDSYIYDMLSICMFYLGNMDKSLYYIDRAIKLDMDNERLLNNKKLIMEYKETNQE